MGWQNITGFQGQLSRNIPPNGCITVPPYIVWKGQFQGTAAAERWVEGRASSTSLQLTMDPTSARNEALALQVNQQITNDLTAGFELNERRGRELINSMRPTGSPRQFANALLSCLSIKQKFNLAGRDVTIGLAGDTDLCFFSVQVQLAQYRPEFPRFDLWGETARVRLNLQGTATLKFGLSRQGWLWLIRQAGPKALMLLRRIGIALGRHVIRPIIAYVSALGAITVTSIVGGILGGIGLSYLTAVFTGSARESGRQWGHCGQYAAGYVGVAWARYDQGEAVREADIERACGEVRPGNTGDQIRLIGVADALENVQDAGGGRFGAIAVRHRLLERIGLPIGSDRHQVISVLRDYLHRTGTRSLSSWH